MSQTEVNAAALQAAATFSQGKSWTQEDVMRLADKFAEYIRTGRAPATPRGW